MAAATYDDALKGGTTTLQELRQTVGIMSRKIIHQDLVELCGETVSVANDVYEMFNIPANTYVLAGGVIPTVADGAVLTADLGDGDNVDGFVDGVDLNTTTEVMTVVADAYGPNNMPGKFYATADTIDLKIISIGAQTSHLAEYVVWIACAQIPLI